jgi:hypothetical protein
MSLVGHLWVVMTDAKSPDRGNVLVQTDADPTGYRFPVCVLDDVSAKDLDLSVAFKPVTGRGDQAAGLVWRYADANNYYIVRANAIENNVVLYKVQDGKRTDLALKGIGRTYGKKVTVPSGQWSTLRVTAGGNLLHRLPERGEALRGGGQHVSGRGQGRRLDEGWFGDVFR